MTLRVSRGPRVDWTAWPDLDPSRADDQLVAAALTEPVEESRALLSYDRGPLIRARIAGLTAYRSPEDWHLPEQSDEAAQEIARLRRDLDAARATRPTITASFLLSGTPSEDLRLRILRLSPLPANLRETLVHELIARHPKEELYASKQKQLFRAYPSFYDGYSEHDIKQYDRDYNNFLVQASKYFATLHDRIENASHAMEIRYVLTNTSSVTATNLVLEFQGAENAIVIASRKDAAKWVGSTAPPSPPERPKTGWSDRWSVPKFCPIILM